MQSNSPRSVTNKKNSFSNFVIQTINHKFKKDLKSESFVDSFHHKRKSPKKNSFTQTNFKSKTNINLKSPKKVGIFKESSTQTSKTTVAMVQTELDMRLSPDSLSPKQGARKSTIRDDDVINMMESVLKVNELGNLSFNRKNNVVQYLESCEEFQKQALLSGNSLTKAFLARIRNRTGHSPVLQSHKQQNSVLNKTIPNSKAITSPTLISQSYLESPKRKESFFIKDKKVKASTKPSRFMVTNVGEKISLQDRTKPVKYYCQSKTSDSTVTPTRAKRSTSFMSPTIASEQKDQSIDMKNIERLISPIRRGRSLSPKKSVVTNPENIEKEKNVPYFDRSNHTLETEANPVVKNMGKPKNKNLEDLHLNLALSFGDMTNTSVSITSSTSTECILFQAISKLKDLNWNTSLRGLADIVEICRVLDNDIILPHMTTINRRLIELIKCARSHVSRTACQAVGPLFEYVKDTRRPEFDELVDTLLYRTADTNKFIRHDANLALDCMVTHVSTFHSIRAICSKGPDHKNPLVRTAAARLIVCAVVIAGPEHILHPHNNEYTRKRVILNMVKFLEDKCPETRKFGQRLYKLLYKDRILDLYLKRYVEKDVVQRLKKCLKSPR